MAFITRWPTPDLYSPETNCTSCHGTALEGNGSAPSCNACHGDLWSFAETHTEIEDGVRHAPGLNSPETNCTSCHGATLEGSGSRPSCYKCHGAKWNEED